MRRALVALGWRGLRIAGGAPKVTCHVSNLPGDAHLLRNSGFLKAPTWMEI